MCLYRSFTTTQFPPEHRGRLPALLDKFGERRDLYRVFIKAIAAGTPHLTLVSNEGRKAPECLLGSRSGHALWLECLAGT